MGKNKLTLVALLVIGGLVLAVSVFVPQSASAQYPDIQGRVNDFAGVLDPTTASELEKKLEQYDNETSNEIAVAIVPDMEGIDIDTYRNELFEKWELGKKDLDNGVLLVVAMDEQDIGIEVGYGLEGSLTDATAGSIIRNEIAPYFKEDNYDVGVTAGVDAIIAATQGEYVAQDYEGDSGNAGEWVGWLIFLGIMVVFIVLGNISRRKRGGKGGSSWWIGGAGGGFSGGGGGFSGGGGGSGGGGASGGW